MILPNTEPSKPLSYLVIAAALLLIGVSLGVPIGARYASGYKNALCPTQVIVRPAHGGGTADRFNAVQRAYEHACTGKVDSANSDLHIFKDSATGEYVKVSGTAIVSAADFCLKR